MATMIKTAVLKILKSLAKVLIRMGVSYQDFSEWSKIAFVEAALASESIKRKKQSNTAIAIITGLHRKDVKRLMEKPLQSDNSEVSQTNRFLRVANGWLQDADFSKNGKAMILPFEGEKSFSELNKRYSGDMKPKAMLLELIENGMVSVDANKNVILISNEFIPKGDIGKVEILGFDSSALIETINRNMDLTLDESLFQKKVYYDNLPLDILPEFKRLVNEKSMSILIELDQFLKKHDNNRLSQDKKCGAGVGIFYFDNENEVKHENS
jgi:hypothetical protein